MKQKITMPSYMMDFKCIAGACEETCCAGWYIAIDEVTYKKYKKVKQPEMKKRFEKELVTKKGASPECTAKIKLKNNRCAFLGKDNLCDIYRTLGEAYLSKTCTMYPRNTNDLGERVELSLALSCPEAARIVLLQKEPIQFTVKEQEALPIVGAKLDLKIKAPKHFEDHLLLMREVLIAIWQESGYAIKQKWQAFENVMMRIYQYQCQQDDKKLKSYLKEMKNASCLKLNLKDNNVLKFYLEPKKVKVLFDTLVQMRANKKWPSASYEAWYSQMLQGLSEALDMKAYQKGEAIFKETLKRAPYIFENYFVNYIYERLVPINQKTVKDSLEEIGLYYACIRLHLIGIASNKGSLEENDIVSLIQSFTRVFDHNELYMMQIKKAIKQ